MLINKIEIIIIFYFVTHFCITNSKRTNTNIQYFLVRNRLFNFKNNLIKNLNAIMEVELKNHAISGYSETLKYFTGNNTALNFLHSFTIKTPSYFQVSYGKNNSIDHFKYKITPYIEKIHYLDIPLQYKTSIIKYCDYSNIKMIRSIYKINKILKYSSEEYIKTNTAKSFIRWKLRKSFL